MKEILGTAVQDLLSLTVEFEHNEMIVKPSDEEGWAVIPLCHPSVSRFYTLQARIARAYMLYLGTKISDMAFTNVNVFVCR